MRKLAVLSLLLLGCTRVLAQEKRRRSAKIPNNHFPPHPVSITDSLADDEMLLARLRNMPNLEVGKGITFRPRNDWFELTMRFRMQNLVALSFDRDFSLTETEARVKRLRLRFDGYIYSPKLVYSIQLGFTGYDAETLPNGNTNIIRDAIVYYVPNARWNIGFGQTKIKANRARINSSSALQFVDRSIVNSQFNLDRDFGFFGEYNLGEGDGFNLSAKGSVTLGEGRNWGNSTDGGLAYTGRLELYPLGRFGAKGDLLEGDFDYEEQVRILLAGAWSFNDNATRFQGQRGAMMPEGETRDINSYFVDFILKYRGWAFYTDFMGRTSSDPSSTPTATPSSTTDAVSTCRPATCSTANGRSPCATRRSFPTAGYSRWPGTETGTRPRSA